MKTRKIFALLIAVMLLSTLLGSVASAEETRTFFVNPKMVGAAYW